MISEKLRLARGFEDKERPLVPPELLPRYHVTGGVGWINDPNGFSVYRGEYHLFFQYYPYETKWGPMHWGHMKTRDFIRWEYLPAALAPDEAFDRDGCFSGSAVEMPDGRQLLMYTGVIRETGEDGVQKEYQTQCVAVGDGVDYEKYPANPVIGASLLPEGGSDRDFRDPKLWREGNTYYCVVGNRCPDGTGAVLLYESSDGVHWTYAASLDASRGRYGRMWECPDFFSLDGTQVLLVSPQEMEAEDLEFVDGFGTLCLLGSYDPAGRRFREERAQAIDYGLDFYAPQTLETLDGRRIMIAWMQSWSTVDFRPAELPFFGQMTVPRELHVRDGRLIQTPVREIESCRVRRAVFQDVPVTGAVSLPGIRGRCIDLTADIRPADPPAGYRSFTLEAALGGDFGVSLTYEPAAGILRVDRSRGGVPAEYRNERAFRVRDRQGGLRLRLLLDRYSLELFVNDGEQAASFTLYAPQNAEDIRFSSEGGVILDVEKFDLEF